MYAMVCVASYCMYWCVLTAYCLYVCRHVRSAAYLLYSTAPVVGLVRLACCMSPKYCALHRSLTGAGDQVELDDLLSPLKKMKSFKSLQKRLVSPSVNLIVCMTHTYDPWVQVVVCLCVQQRTHGTSAVYECVVDCVHVCLLVASAAVCPCRCLCEC